MYALLSQIVDCVSRWVDAGKFVVIAALDATYERKVALVDPAFR
jgi:hypothetical protein